MRRRRPYNTRFYNHWAWYAAWMGVGGALTAGSLSDGEWVWAAILGLCTVSFIGDFIRAANAADRSRRHHGRD